MRIHVLWSWSDGADEKIDIMDSRAVFDMIVCNWNFIIFYSIYFCDKYRSIDSIYIVWKNCEKTNEKSLFKYIKCTITRLAHMAYKCYNMYYCMQPDMFRSLRLSTRSLMHASVCGCQNLLSFVSISLICDCIVFVMLIVGALTSLHSESVPSSDSCLCHNSSSTMTEGGFVMDVMIDFDIHICMLRNQKFYLIINRLYLIKMRCRVYVVYSILTD